MAERRVPVRPAVVDASVWVARYVPSDAFHTRSHAWLRRQLRTRRTLVVPSLLLPELAGSLARVLNDTELALRAAYSITRLRHVRIVPLDAVLARQACHLAAELRLRGADAVYAAAARRLRAPLVSWDGEQINRASAVTP